MEKKASDFRYNTGETKVPWAAVGENYNAQDLMTIIRFMMKGKGEAYDEALKTVEKDVLALDKGFRAPGKAVAGRGGWQGREYVRRISAHHWLYIFDQLHSGL